ncbi:MAG: anthranilate phosphoribosyltransferase [Gammaproteobacteria bacterium]|nr:anthranilate phosphoribosyltransferase [Gammaproteobacteria bacterium]
MEIKEAISRIVDREDLSRADMEAVMRQIMTGGATPIQIGGFLAGLRAKGETVEEIAAAATVMRELAVHVRVSPAHLVDTCGTGGDGARLFNVSTAAAFVVAAGGGRVAKHGNRAMSGSSGSADVLEALGVKLDLPPERIARCIDEVGVGFLYAPTHHSATRYASAPRKELGTRTLFNLLGPLTNPADVPHQLLGVFAPRWVEPLAKVLRTLGSRHVLVVHSEDYLDEISVAAPTRVAELQAGQIRSYEIQPRDFGMRHDSLDALRVTSVQESLALIHEAIDGRPGPAFDMVALNAGAALYAADVVTSLAEGVQRAREVMQNGTAAQRLARLVEASRV